MQDVIESVLWRETPRIERKRKHMKGRDIGQTKREIDFGNIPMTK